MKWIRLALGVLSVLWWGSGVCMAGDIWPGGEEKDTGPVKIGVFLALTGEAAFLGQPAMNTLQLYVDEINRAGGVIGRSLKLIAYDTAGKALIAREKVIQLIETDQVHLLIGGSTSGSSLAVIPLVERAKIPYISLAASVAITEPVKKWVFKTPHTDRNAAEKIFYDISQRGFRRIALVYSSGGFGRSGRIQSRSVLEGYGLELAEEIVYQPGAEGLEHQLSQLRNRTDLDAVVNFDSGRGAVAVTKAFRDEGIELPLYQSHGVASERYIELAGQAADGVRFPAPAMLIAEQLPDGDERKDILLRYINRYQEAFLERPSAFGGYAYDALMLTVSALENTGTTRRARIRDALERTANYVGTAGLVNMSRADHLGLSSLSFLMLEIIDGQWKVVRQ